VTARRSGRRPGDSGARELILDAARRSFGAAGFAGTTIRGVAGAAGVDPALVHHYFGSKDDLFAASLELPVDPSVLVPQIVGDGGAGVGARVVRAFLGVWDATPGQGPMLALLRSAVSDERAAASLRDLLARVALGPVARGIGADRPELRAALAATQMTGLAVTRYVIRLEPVASAPAEALVSAVGPTVERYLLDPL
jgi:AcrR family transcriptional regulator